MDKIIKKLPEKFPAILFDRDLSINEKGSFYEQEVKLSMPKGFDLLVKVEAVSVNPIDTKLRQSDPDIFKQKILGYDAYGEVAAVGEKAAQFSIGEKIYYAGSSQRPGSDQKYQLVDSRLVGKAPKNLSADQIAAMPLTTITAYEILIDHLLLKFKKNYASGKKILIINGAGGVGSILIQLSAYLGLEVFTTAHSQQAKKWLKQYPIKKIFDYTLLDSDNDFKKMSFDYIVFLYDPSVYLDKVIRHIKPFGRLVSIVGTDKGLHLGYLKNIGAQFSWEYMFAKSDFDVDKKSQGVILNNLADMFDSGVLKSTVNVCFKSINAENLRRAHLLVEQGQTVGKVVLLGSFGENS